MPILISAKKRLRQNPKRRSINDRYRRTMKESIKLFTKAIDDKDVKAASEMLAKSYKAIDKSVKQGVIKKNTAARKKSNLAKMVAAIAQK